MDDNEKKATITFTRLKDPAGCSLWTEEKGLVPPFEMLRSFIDTSHFERSLVRCRECGQLYYSEFYEIVDYDDGDDVMYSTYIPVDDDPALLDKLNNMSPLEILSVFPRLNWDGGIKWIGKRKEGA